MIEDHDLWSGWVTTLREQGLHESVAWLIKAGKPVALLVSQMITMALPLFSGIDSYNKLSQITTLLEDGDQLDAFSRALQDDWGDT
jgi:hypothetical protein